METRKKFYNIFWKEKTCQNLFMLSKHELLDTITIESLSYFTNKIIISNDNKVVNDTNKIVQYRSEHQMIEIESMIQEKIEHFKPLLDHFINHRFKKSIDLLQKDVEEKGLRLLMKIIKILFDEERREELSIKFLKEYKFIGNNINSFKDLSENIQKQLIPKKGNKLINEVNISIFMELVRFVKDFYEYNIYKKLISSNQILVNTRSVEDNFESRIKMFKLLYDAKILLNSSEDAFIECTHCDPDTYKGVFKLKVNPSKLEKLKCPVCNEILTYYVPYKLENEIFEIVKSQDGLLLDALTYKLEENNIKYKVNQHYENDIEVDCVFETQDGVYIIETKMYQNNNQDRKIVSKIKEDYGKLLKDYKRLKKIIGKEKNLIPILLINILDETVINEAIQDINNTQIFVRNIQTLKFSK